MNNISKNSVLNRKLKLGMIYNTGFAVLEIVIGFFSGSLALVSDATHNLADSLSLLIAFVGEKISGKKPTPKHTFGYGKAAILTALVNSLILVLIAFFLFYQAYQRIISPQPVKGGLVMIVAGVGILVNTGVALMFIKHRESINIKSAFLNMAFDALASVGALVAGFLIIITGHTIFDPIISIIIGTMLLISSLGITSNAIHILLEGAPEHINPLEVEQIIKNITGVKGVHDFHLWTIASQNAALSCHVVTEHLDLSSNTQMIKNIKAELLKQFGIRHVTIETELKECPPHEH